MQSQQRLRRNYAKLNKAIESHCPALAILIGYRFVHRYPDVGPGWLLLGGILSELARYEEAERALLRALELASLEHRWAPLQQLGRLFREAGDY